MDSREAERRLLERLRAGGDRGSELIRRQVERELERGEVDRQVRLANLERRRASIGSAIGHADYYAAAKALGDLRGYWRLGDGDQPYLDTSDYSPSSPANLSIDAGAAAMTKDLFPGVLPTAYDEGAVAFPNLTDKVLRGRDRGLADQQDYLVTALSTGGGGDPRFKFTGNVPFSVGGWVWLLPAPGGETFDGGIIGCSQSFTGSSTPHYMSGWRLYGRWNPAYPSAAVWFTRGDKGTGTNLEIISSVPVANYAPADQWFHVMGTYDGTSAIKLYFNGGLADSDVDAHALINTGQPQVRIGYDHFSQDDPVLTHTSHNDLYGKTDEFGIWSRELTAGEVAALAALGNVESAEAAGKTYTANGAGGQLWDYPTIETRLNGA